MFERTRVLRPEWPLGLAQAHSRKLVRMKRSALPLVRGVACGRDPTLLNWTDIVEMMDAGTPIVSAGNKIPPATSICYTIRTMTALNPAPPDFRATIIMRLYELFRAKGYEGVSIGDVSAATGLGRSSLYHHFPGGKEEMARAVIRFTRDALTRMVFEPLAEPGPIEARVDAMLAAVGEIYSGGETPCVLASLLTSASDGPLATGVAQILSDWVDAIARVLPEDEVAHGEGSRRAAAALAQIQGALVLTRALRRSDLFDDALRTARGILMG